MRLNKSKALRTAEKYILQGKLSAAIDEYRKVVDSDPADLTTVNTLGDLYVRVGRVEDAIFNFSLIGEHYRENGFGLKAIAMFKKILKLDPARTETGMKLASLYLQQGFLVKARQLYCQTAEQYLNQGKEGKALDTYQRVLALDPSNALVRMKMGEIYCRQELAEQAHDSFITAAAEFARSRETEQALNSYIKAISVYPDSHQALSSIAKIYTEHGEADRAINILCAGLEKAPEDVELLSLLGSAYLAAGSMDEAERTFLTVIALDRNRYDHLFEVGQVFLQMGDLDRASEQIDGCLDILIAKRQEDKAISFLRQVLDCDPCHIGSLERLAWVFSRTGDDPNLTDTLRALAEAGIRKGNDQASIAALKELTRLEPDEPMYIQRLYDLGVRENVKVELTDNPPNMIPLDYQREVFDDASVMAQISKAEMSAKQGEIEDAVSTLREIIDHYPNKLQPRVKLKEIYEQAGMIELAANECVRLARLHEARGELARASDYIAEARQLYPVIESASLIAENQPACGSSGEVGASLECESEFDDLTEDRPVYDEEPFHLPEVDEPNLNEIHLISCLADSLDLRRNDQDNPSVTPEYQACSDESPTSDSPADDGSSLLDGQPSQTEPLNEENPPADLTHASADESLFNLPEPDELVSKELDLTGYLIDSLNEQPSDQDELSAALEQETCFDESLTSDPPLDDQPSYPNESSAEDSARPLDEESPLADLVYASTGELRPDTIPPALNDELEGVDFDFSLGFAEIAHQSLDKLREEYGDHPEILSRYQRLDAGADQPLGAASEGRAPTELETASLRPRPNSDLINTLETLAEAALRNGKGREAIEALKNLARLDPNETTYRQRLYNLGVRDFMKFDLPSPVRTTVSPDCQGGAFDDASVMKEIFKAEVAARRGEIERAVAILRQITDRDPDNVLARAKLRDAYTRAGLIDLAANESLQLARLYEARNASARANTNFAPALQTNQLIESLHQRIGNVERFNTRSELPPTWQRKVERVALSLPLLVASDDGIWREYTESLNVSQLGLMFRLMHLVEPGTPLRIKLPMPVKLRLHQSDERLYAVSAVVCHATERAGETLVGVEFQTSVEHHDK